jgi:hypothetical protein
LPEKREKVWGEMYPIYNASLRIAALAATMRKSRNNDMPIP